MVTLFKPRAKWDAKLKIWCVCCGHTAFYDPVLRIAIKRWYDSRYGKDNHGYR